MPITSLDKPRNRFLPYSRQNITAEDIAAVEAVLRSDLITQGPTVPAFEAEFAQKVGARQAVACASGTAALHLAMMALGIGEGDVVVTSANSFLASANCARYVGAEVRFTDVDPDTGLMDIESLRKILKADKSGKIKAIVPVHFSGQTIDLPAIYWLAEQHGAKVVADACHAVGAAYWHEDRLYQTGESMHSHMNVFSFHPVKHIAMGEGGAITSDDPKLISRLELFRNHGIQKENFESDELALDDSGKVNPWYYEMKELGYNFRLTEMQAALGISQLKRIDDTNASRRILADTYRKAITKEFPDRSVRSLVINNNRALHGYHLFVVLIDFDVFDISRAELMHKLKDRDIGTQVHYIPIPYQPYYQKRYGLDSNDFPGVDRYYRQALSIPLFPQMSDEDCRYVIESLKECLGA